VSPSLRAVADSPLKQDKIPALIAAGDRDKLVDSGELKAELITFGQRPETQIFEGVDHFWYGQEGRLVPEVGRFFTEQLK